MPGARWEFIKRHCRLAVERGARGGETATMHSMRARLMAYSHGMPGAKALRGAFQHVSTLADLDAIAEAHLAGEKLRVEG